MISIQLEILSARGAESKEMIDRLSTLVGVMILGLTCLVAACGYLESKEEIVAWVRTSLQQEIQKNQAYNGLTIGEIVLVRESVNKFTGYVDFRYGADVEKANLTVIVDGNQKMYQCDPPRALILKRNIAQLGAMMKQKPQPESNEKDEPEEPRAPAWQSSGRDCNDPGVKRQFPILCAN